MGRNDSRDSFFCILAGGNSGLQDFPQRQRTEHFLRERGQRAHGQRERRPLPQNQLVQTRDDEPPVQRGLGEQRSHAAAQQGADHGFRFFQAADGREVRRAAC